MTVFTVSLPAPRVSFHSNHLSTTPPPYSIFPRRLSSPSDLSSLFAFPSKVCFTYRLASRSSSPFSNGRQPTTAAAVPSPPILPPTPTPPFRSNFTAQTAAVLVSGKCIYLKSCSLAAPSRFERVVAYNQKGYPFATPPSPKPPTGGFRGGSPWFPLCHPLLVQYGDRTANRAGYGSEVPLCTLAQSRSAGRLGAVEENSGETRECLPCGNSKFP